MDILRSFLTLTDLSADCAVIVQQLGTAASVLQLFTGDSERDLHNQRDWVRKQKSVQANKNLSLFPSNEALMKLFYLALRNISQRWTMPIRDWKAALTHFSILFHPVR